MLIVLGELPASRGRAQRYPTLALFAVRREAVLGQRLVGALVELADPANLARFRAVAISRPNSREMRTICSICLTVLIFALRSCVQRLSSMPQRTCSPIAMPIMLIGSTLSMELSTVTMAPSGIARRKLARL